MAIATQHYKLNEDTQLSTVQQLTAFSATDYVWTGRTLTSWTDDAGQNHQIDDIVSFDRTHAKLSGNWVLNRYPVLASIATGHGKIVVTTENAQLPLAEVANPVRKIVELSNGEQSSIWYNSNLSIDCIPDDEYKTSRFIVNKTPVDPLSSQYVYDGLTKNTSFNISAGFQLDSSKAGISASDGTNVWKLTYDDISAPAQPLAYVNSSGVVQAPFSTQTNMTSKYSLQQIVDEHGIVSAIADYAFFDCDGLSTVDAIVLPNAISVGQGTFSNCNNLPYVNLSNATYIGPYAFYYCPNLSSIECQKLSSVENSTFSDSGIMSISLPKLGG